MHRLREIIIILLGFYFVLVFMVYLYQDKLLFFPDNSRFSECHEAISNGFQINEIQFKQQNIRFLSKIDPSAKATLILFYGNASTSCASLSYYQELKDLKINFILAAYPGYEGDRTKPGQEVFLKNAEAIFDYLKQQTYAKMPIIIFGESLGTGVATYLASIRTTLGLILRTPYTSVSEVGFYHYPFLPVSLINRNPFPAFHWAPQVKCPVLILHGTNDETIPLKFGQKEATFFKTPIKFVTIDDVGHNDIADSTTELFWKSIRNFIIGQIERI